jgi:hypothetical protein
MGFFQVNNNHLVDMNVNQIMGHIICHNHTCDPKIIALHITCHKSFTTYHKANGIIAMKQTCGSRT